MRNVDSAVLRGITQLSLLSGHLVHLLERLTRREAATANLESSPIVHADLLSALELQKQVVAEHFALVRSMLRRQRRQSRLTVVQSNDVDPIGIPKTRPNGKFRATETSVMPNSGPNATRIQSFTKRQRQIVELVALGYDNKEIAQSLGLAEQTVKNHLHTIFEKAGVSRRSDLTLNEEQRTTYLPGPETLVENNSSQQQQETK